MDRELVVLDIGYRAVAEFPMEDAIADRKAADLAHLFAASRHRIARDQKSVAIRAPWAVGRVIRWPMSPRASGALPMRSLTGPRRPRSFSTPALATPSPLRFSSRPAASGERSACHIAV